MSYPVIETASPDKARAVKLPLWWALRERTEPAGIRQLAREIGASPNAVQLRLISWLRAGFLTVSAATGNAARRAYLMTDAARKMNAPPSMLINGRPTQARQGRDRMWKAIRTLRRFDLPTLIMVAEVTRRSAEDFINCLLRAGILIRLARGHSMSATWSVYALAGSFGPRTPVVRHREAAGERHREVFDPNTGEIHDISPRRKAQPLFFDDGN